MLCEGTRRRRELGTLAGRETLELEGNRIVFDCDGN